MNRNLTHKEHLGDGLYAGWDGFRIVLWADRDNGRHWVALEPEVFQALVDYSDRLAEGRK